MDPPSGFLLGAPGPLQDSSWAPVSRSFSFWSRVQLTLYAHRDRIPGTVPRGYPLSASRGAPLSTLMQVKGGPLVDGPAARVASQASPGPGGWIGVDSPGLGCRSPFSSLCFPLRQWQQAAHPLQCLRSGFGLLHLLSGSREMLAILRAGFWCRNAEISRVMHRRALLRRLASETL